ncbi:hypothetical protein [Agrobacterium genomosp. 2]|uniref:Uncharacterized protein n=1 Tax=Agrobacterium genomosp. 2 str. CFBP 5494 TaxID=1183436 RepID=A0A9W5B2C5_9HYPH|nr:hypothetical protein [Agrobacterium genomosp. 2]CUW93625.1 hypothetical protein AGR2A_Cc70062 [Agrobacterium genomosp. 2 str. CFBP 5494]
MSKALKRAAEVTAVIADLKHGTDFLSDWLASQIRENSERADDGLSHPTLAIRVAIKDGKPKGQMDLYDRTRPMPKQRDNDFRVELDTMFERELSPRDVHEFLRSSEWRSLFSNRQLVKGLIQEARASHGA